VKSEDTTGDVRIGGGFEDNADYVDLDHGSPPVIDAQSDEGEEDASDTSGNDDDDEDDGGDEDSDDDGHQDDGDEREHGDDDVTGESVSVDSEDGSVLVVH
jgi:hypothetical protein